ncbi:hypothetical protein [Thorsellia kenyensis]|uniref:Uncharacterized protein n=1 Tax=Thorsellia kenyensis TaxID=1549888 RepID=A0ABV6CD73_9GAMM
MSPHKDKLVSFKLLTPVLMDNSRIYYLYLHVIFAFWRFLRVFFIAICFILTLFSSYSLHASPFLLNFAPQQREILTDPHFIETLIKSAGSPVVSKSQMLNDSQELTQTFLFQKNSTAPLSFTINQNALTLSWNIPKANTQELYQVNSENQRIMVNLLNYLFGNSQLITPMITNENSSFQTLSANGFWRITFIKDYAHVSVKIIPLS